MTSELVGVLSSTDAGEPVLIGRGLVERDDATLTLCSESNTPPPGVGQGVASGVCAADELADAPVEEPAPDSVELVDVCDRLEMASGCCMEWYNADRRKPCEGNIRLG